MFLLCPYEEMLLHLKLHMKTFSPLSQLEFMSYIKITIALKFMSYINSDLPIPAKKLQTPG